jgi:transposase-like protein
VPLIDGSRLWTCPRRFAGLVGLSLRVVSDAVDDCHVRSGVVRGGDGGLLVRRLHPEVPNDLGRALGADIGISKPQGSRICAGPDADVAAFAASADNSPAHQAFPDVFLDAIYCEARVNQRVVSQAVATATSVAADGHREVLAFAVGGSEDGAFWTRSCAR